MKYEKTFIEYYENTGDDEKIAFSLVKAEPGVKIVKSTINGPVILNRNSLLGPDASIGKYSHTNTDCHIGRAEVGSFCSLGCRVVVNPFNHPLGWLSMHEFQYRSHCYSWIEEYRNLERLKRSADMFKHTTVGSDVWMGHNVTVLAGVHIGHGAAIGAGSVVTKDVPPYAVVAGVPAILKKYRFDEKTIERLLSVRWWDMELSELSGFDFRDVSACLSILEKKRARLDEFES